MPKHFVDGIQRRPRRTVQAPEARREHRGGAVNGILRRAFTLALLTAATIGSTTAFFNDTETSTGNTFSAIPMNLMVGDSEPSTWRVAVGNMLPGDTGGAEVVVKNDSGLEGTLSITFADYVDREHGCAEPEGLPEGVDTTCGDPGDGEGELGAHLVLLFYLDENASDAYEDGTDTLVYQGAGSGIMAGGLAWYALAAGGARDLRVEWELPSATGNVVQTDETSFSVVFTLEQA